MTMGVLIDGSTNYECFYLGRSRRMNPMLLTDPLIHRLRAPLLATAPSTALVSGLRFAVKDNIDGSYIHLSVRDCGFRQDA